MRFAPVFLGLLVLGLPVLPQTPQTVARIMTQPPLSADEVAAMEAKLVENPDDLNLRMRLLTHYRDMAPAPSYDDPVKRSARLRHILYVIEHHADAVDPASPLVYVPRKSGAYANDVDHAMARDLWVRVAEANPENQKIALNAAWFLFVEDKQEAEEFLRRAWERQPGNQRLAANLGFLYGMQILGLDGWGGGLTDSPPAERAEAKRRAIAELENSSNAAVIAGAATAIPNLAMQASRGAEVDPELFELSSRLMARARALAPNDEALRGPMPMIDYFAENRQRNSGPGAISPGPSGGPLTPSRIRIGANVLKTKLLYAPEAAYPDLARNSDIKGSVRFDAVVAADGTISGLTLRSGHPLLVQAAMDAVKQWRFQPTLLNGKPVEVATEIVVSFPPAQ